MKKFLSLVLALVMTMSLVTISAGAKDFTDADKVNYDEAIAVLSAVKVIDGYTDGSFKPQTQLNRGQAAKIICNLILGPTTAAELHATAAPFSDVPADNIFAGYITYCANKGIIGGYADGTFRPTGTLTGYAFMKMLLGALGYDANIEGYNIPGSWSIQVAKQAIGIGLNKGLKDTFDGTKAVTREEACLYALNTLKADLVEYGSKTNITVGGSAVVIGDSEAKAQKWNNSITKIENIKKDGYIQFAEQYFPKLELEIGNGIYGRPTNVWKLKKAEIGAFTSIEPTIVYTKSVDGDDVYKDLGKVVCNEKEYDWTAYVNGLEVDADDVVVPAKGMDKEWAYTGEGTVTEVYVDDEAETVTVCEINYYLGQVSKVKSDDDGEYITVSVLSKGAKDLADKTFYVEGYEEDDYVVFTMDWNDDDDEYVIGEVCEPETVTGEVTRVELDKDNTVKGKDAKTGETYLKMDGDKYTYTEDAAKPAQQSHMVYDLDGKATDVVHPTLNEEYIIYLDPNGYVLGFKLANEEESKYLFVKDADEELEDWIAKVVLGDATTPKVDVDKDLNKTVKMTAAVEVPYVKEVKGKTSMVKFAGEDDEVEWIKTADGESSKEKDVTNIENLIWKYSVNKKDVYELTYIPISAAAVKGEKTQYAMNDAEIHNGKAYVTDGDNTFIVDMKTVFVDTINDKVYTGYKEVPNVSEGELAYVLDGKIAEVVFILGGEIYDEASNFFMLLKNTRESFKYDGDPYWAYSKAYVNGEKTTLNVAYDADKDAKDTVLKVGQLYQVKKTIDKDYITEVKAVCTDPTHNHLKGELVRPLYDVLTVGVDAFWLDIEGNQQSQKDEAKFDTDEDTVFVVVEKNAKGEVEKIYDGKIDDMDEDDDYDDIKVQVVKQDKQTAELVYIYKTVATIEADKTKGNGTVEVTVNGAQDTFTIDLADPKDTEKVDISTKTLKANSTAKVVVTMTVDGDTYIKETTVKQADAANIGAVLDAAEYPNVEVAKTGTHKFVVTAKVTCTVTDGGKDVAYTLTGTSPVFYW